MPRTLNAEYAYTTADDPGTAVDTVTYAYTNENWGDLLKTYDGGTLYYDNCGNLTSDPTWRYTWEHGRQLSSMAAKDGSVTWNYEYDVDGLRLSRTDGTTEYGYVYLGGELVRMTIDDDVVMLFAYDADGTPMSVVYNGTTYYYAKNVQGDVVAILSNTGKPVVCYTYDAWGNILSITGTKASTLGADNPLRYRGYVYDVETELYYLQSRYYDPEWGRFINADAFVSTGQGFLGNNMFAYCNNNPVNYSDATGCLPVIILFIWDYYYIHRRVQEEISFYYGYAMEVYVRKPDGKTGRLDLYDAENNEFYEVKSVGAAYTTDTLDQMNSYSQSCITDWRFSFLKEGNIPTSGSNTSIQGSFEYSVYTVTYETKSNGLVVYSVDYNPEALAALAAGVMLMALGGCGVSSAGSLRNEKLRPAHTLY